MAYSYDANGNLVSKTDARNITTNYTYDVLNRNTSVDYSNTTALNPDITRIYDNTNPDAYGKGRLWSDYARGDLTNGTDTDHTAIDSYDALGRPLSVRQHFKVNGVWKPGVSVGYTSSVTYDLAGNVKTMTYPSGRTVNYSYDDAGRLSSFIGKLGDGQPRTYSTIAQYHPAGMIERETFGTQSPLHHKKRYNNRLQLGDLRLSTGSDALSYDRGAILFLHGPNAVTNTDPFANDPTNNGNLVKQLHYVPIAGVGETIPQADNYTYDALNRISGVIEPNVFTQTYGYDQWGNRWITSATGGVNSYNPTYDPGSNRIDGLSYDPAGNITSDLLTGGTMIYDAENRLLTASAGGGGTYTYDANGKRTRRTAGGQETWHIYGFGGELLAEYAAEGAPSTPLKEYGYRGGQLLIIAESGSGGGTSLVKPASESRADVGKKTDQAMEGNAHGPFVVDEPVADLEFNEDSGSTTTGVTGDNNTGALIDNAPSAPQKEYRNRSGLAILTPQSGGVITVNPSAYQGSVTDISNTGHGSTSADAYAMDIQLDPSQNITESKSARWSSFQGGPSSGIISLKLKFDWAVSGNVDAFVQVSGSASARINFDVDYSIDGGVSWTNALLRSRLASQSGQGSKTDSINSDGGSVEIVLSPSQNISLVQVRDSMWANAVANAPNVLHAYTESGATISASVSSIRLEVEVETTAPVISNVAAGGITAMSATITWNTNENSDSQVEYGPIMAYGQSTTLNPALVTAHSQGLSGLTAGTLYHYRVKSRDAAGNLAVSGDFTFTTAPPPDTTAPVISNVAAGGITTSGATITWNTNENSDSQVEYGTSTAYGQSTTLNPALVTAHSQGLSGLAANTLYHYRVKSKDAAGNLAVSGDFTFTTAQNGSAAIKWVVTDHLGSTRMVIDETGSLEGIKRHDYLPFGEELSADVGIRSASNGYSGDSVRQKFTGYEQDIETGLEFAQARYLSRTQGRFTSVDPLTASGDPAEPQSWNRYAYVLNRPLLLTDPTGLKWGYFDTTDGQRIFRWFDGEVGTDELGNRYQGVTSAYFIAGNGIGVWLDLNSSNHQFFSSKYFSPQAWDSLVRTQIDGGVFTAEQIKAIDVGRAFHAYDDNKLEIELIPTVLGGGINTIASSGRGAMALGLRKFMYNVAEDTSSHTYENWVKAGLTNISPFTAFEQSFLDAAKNASRINFALDGIFDGSGVGASILRGSRGLLFPRNTTNWELYTIYNRPDFFGKTQFFYKGSLFSPLVRPKF